MDSSIIRNKSIKNKIHHLLMSLHTIDTNIPNIANRNKRILLPFIWAFIIQDRFTKGNWKYPHAVLLFDNDTHRLYPKFIDLAKGTLLV